MEPQRRQQAREGKRSMKKSVITACCAIGLIATAAHAPEARAETLTAINISYQPTNYWALPFYVATKNGWWKEVGLEPHFVLFPAGVPQMAAAAAGSWDVGATGSVPAVIGAARFGVLTIGVDNDESTTNALLASAKDYAAFSADPKKIAGERILLTTNSTVDYAVRSCLAHWGVAEDAVQLVNLGQAAIVTSFISGDAKLGGLWAPYSYSAEEKAGAKMLCSGETAGVTIPGVLVAREAYAKEHPKLVAAYLAVYVHAWQWAKAHPKDAADMLKAADVEGGVPLSDSGLKEEFKRPTFSLDQELAMMKVSNDQSELRKWMSQIGAFLKKVGSVASTPEAKSYVTGAYMELVSSDPKLRAFANSSQ
jgi:ABC-type nitrate/sulfonate/bicarbonate transport system substrate-binding protein